MAHATRELRLLEIRAELDKLGRRGELLGLRTAEWIPERRIMPYDSNSLDMILSLIKQLEATLMGLK